MLSNEVFALACRAYYDEMGLVVDETNGEFAHSPLTRKECDTGYYLLHEHHQQQGLLQSRDLDKCCFFAPDVLRWLRGCSYWPDNYFDLWDIYQEYSSKQSRENGKKNAKKLHSIVNEEGKSVQGLRNAERLNAEKNEDGKSIQGLRNAERLNAEKNEEGKSVNALKGLREMHKEKTLEGKSVNALRAAEKAHSKRNFEGKSLLGIKNLERLHAEKNEEGKSVNAVKGGKESVKKLHSIKTEEGKSVAALKVATQIWESSISGFRGNAGNVAKHNKANGWDPSARFRVK